MEIDPAALSRTNTSNGRASATPSVPAKQSESQGGAAQKSGKTTQSYPRVDLEPLYKNLKNAIGDHWATYKDAFSRFLTGYLSQREVERLTDRFLLDPHVLHLHNQFVCAIHANLYRDTPESGVAPWVSANDKPTSVSKPAAGDVAEQRLKSEVMHLPHRMRIRLKGVQDEQQQPLVQSLVTESQARNIQSVQQAGLSTASSGSTGLNKDLDIRKRYTQSLISEAHDLPSSSSITDRIIPICYEEGLQAGPSSTEGCSSLLSTALDTFVKEALTGIVARSRIDAPVSRPKADPVAGSITTGKTEANIRYELDLPRVGIITTKYKKKLIEEETAFHRGKVKRSEEGLLPIEIDAAAKLEDQYGARGDLRIAWEMQDHWLNGLGPWQGEKVLLDGENRHLSEIEAMMEENGDGRRNDIKVNGVRNGLANGVGGSNGVVNGVNNEDDDSMAIDDSDWGWQGATSTDRGSLSSLLDDCLNIEQ